MHDKEKLLTKGTYGCVYKNPLPCKKDIKKPKNKVGKITRKQDGDNEILISNIIKTIPNYKNYYIIQERSNCVRSNFTDLRNVYESQCEVYKESKDKDLVQLISNFGGRTTHGIYLPYNFDFLRSLKHMLEGLVKLEEKGICHYDLHEGNILMDFYGVLRIIDFGKSILGDNLTEKQLANITYEFEPTFAPQPPEFAMHNAFNAGIDFKTSFERIFLEKEIFKIAENFLGLSIHEQKINLMNFWKSQPNLVWIPFYIKYWRVSDTWAIGVYFLTMIKKYSENYRTMPRNMNILTAVLKGCLESSPDRRFTAEKALLVLSSHLS